METHPVTAFFRQFNIKSIHSIEHDLKILKRTYDMPTSLEIIKLAILRDGQHKIEAKEGKPTEMNNETSSKNKDKEKASELKYENEGRKKVGFKNPKQRYKKMTVNQLKVELRKRGKTVTGNKDVLIERLLND